MARRDTGTRPAPDPEGPQALADERAHHERCRAALAAMAAGAREHVVTAADVSASGADAEVLGRALRTKARDLGELPPGPLFFGRLDFAAAPGDEGSGDERSGAGPVAGRDADAAPHAGQSYHIGRTRITEEPTAPPLVVDWRAPVSRAFYQAGPHDPRGVAVRRRFGWAPGSTGAPHDLTGLEDEYLGPPGTGDEYLGRSGTGAGPGGEGTGPGGTGTESGTESGPGTASGTGTGTESGAGTGTDVGVAGGFLAAEIRRPRTGPMRDIAATIQPEQDDLVRSPLGTSLCVQGAPGTGKTAVGLHRAAYLLYTHPRRISRSGLLVLGPNRTFLRYIAEVLPALGEGGVGQLTVEDLVARHPVTGHDPEATALVKHDARMARVLRRALYARVRPEAVDGAGLTVADGSYRWRVPAGELTAIVADVLAEELPYDTGRERVRARVAARARELAERRSGPRADGWLRRTARARPVAAFLDAVWPRTSPEEVLAGLLSGPQERERAADGVLGPAERAALGRARPFTARSARWSAADLVLLDELAGLLELPAGHGHIVVDEAQDLSPMQCRAIGRRAPHGSLTVLGDVAQGTTPWAARSWPEQLAHLGRPDARTVALTTGFRVPAQVTALANRLLARLDVPVPPGRSLREDGSLTVRRVPDVVAAAVAAVRAARNGTERLGAPAGPAGPDIPAGPDGPAGALGSVGVIAADADVPRLRAALTAAGLAPADPAGPAAPGAPVTLLPATLAKGLEYDHVIAVEPAAIEEAEPRGAHRLYVVLTRAVTHLEILHTRPLPFG
ncbi:HelD family protein [Streptomyces uncialis]|uniref:HelD family protein n=1 Tax=Streptomyces uncialis TaxID=1048205 RepID=UPI0037B45DC9